ncbi:uncharacterized protein G6M90_00g106990 [Metarhizium brunneum]|uniref:Uncharacterized protein n=1 Tax=Metarhizium brunneum TaxID=500148 RepID=A0A7D5Z7S1_9HYPO|nr:hypothetical protein G6M90_00g106990 [Metarhizium brunneum]
MQKGTNKNPSDLGAIRVGCGVEIVGQVKPRSLAALVLGRQGPKSNQL